MGERCVMATSLKYRLTQDIVIPKGTRVIFIAHIRQEAYRQAQALISHSPYAQSEWQINFDEAIKAGLIEKVES